MAALPFYVSPEQIMQDKAEYARKGIARGRSAVVLRVVEGILLAADNPSAGLHKISEVYDRIAFAGVGKYSEFENLRKAGIRHADLKGYTYSREDVTARSLANAYSQLLGTAFSQEMKPLEVEIVLAEVGYNGRSDEIYRVSYDGSIFDEPHFAAVGGKAEPLTTLLKERLPELPSLSRGVQLLKEVFAEISGAAMPLSQIEAGLLDRSATGRVFRRLGVDELAALSGEQS
ncbi:MAG: proteasome subunit alpha [Leptospirillia bacterium]